MAARDTPHLWVSSKEMTAPVYKTSAFGISCITNESPDLSKMVNGSRKAEAIVSVDACGTENGQRAAWIVVNDKGLVTFFNQNGDKSACALDNGLKVGSQCSASILGSAPSSSTPAFDSQSTSFVSGSSTPPWPGKTPASGPSHKTICGV